LNNLSVKVVGLLIMRYMPLTDIDTGTDDDDDDSLSHSIN